MRDVAIRPAALAIVLLACGNTVLGDTQNLVVSPYPALLCSDFIVRAIIVHAQSELVPELDYDPRPPFMKGFVRISRVRLDVEEVLKGVCDSTHIDLVSEGHVDIRQPEGREVIVGANFDELLMGGSYPYRQSQIFFRSRSGWASYSGVIDDTELREAIHAVSIERLAEQADIVATAIVDSIWRSTFSMSVTATDRSAEIEAWRLRLLGIRKGTDVPDLVSLQLIRRGSYRPAWRYPMPRKIDQGDSVYVFLKRDEDVYHALGGMNGCLEVIDSHLIYNDRIVLDDSISELDRRVSQSLQKPKE